MLHVHQEAAKEEEAADSEAEEEEANHRQKLAQMGVVYFEGEDEETNQRRGQKRQTKNWGKGWHH